jgi:hypothetical protein
MFTCKEALYTSKLKGEQKYSELPERETPESKKVEIEGKRPMNHLSKGQRFVCSISTTNEMGVGWGGNAVQKWIIDIMQTSVGGISSLCCLKLP